MKQNYILCPICGKHKFPIWEDNGTCICPYCGWGHDIESEKNTSEVCGPNDLSLDDYKLRYEYYLANNSNYRWQTDNYPEIPQIEKCWCPVCGKSQFEPLSWYDIYCEITPSDIFCIHCGWHYDTKQSENHNLKNSANEMSLNEYKVWYNKKISDDSTFNYLEETTRHYLPTPHICPICGRYEFVDIDCYDICPYCGWEDDGTENDDTIVGANNMSFSDYRSQYMRKIENDPAYIWKKY